VEQSTDTDRTVIGKTATILLTFLNGAAHTFTEIVAATGLPLSTAHRLIAQLTESAILERTADGGYRVGRQMRLIGAASRPAATFESLTSLPLHDLSEALDAEVRLGVLTAHGVTFIEKRPGRRPVSTFAHARNAPVHATAMGKALLAFSPPAVVDRFLAHRLSAHTPQTITSPARLRRVLDSTRRNRLAVDWQELEAEVGGLAVPVFDRAEQVIAAVEVRVDNPSAELSRVRPALTLAGRRLGRELSIARYSWPPGPRRAVKAPERRTRTDRRKTSDAPY
jgi:DNA-binding IclR family transcriptional regulator